MFFLNDIILIFFKKTFFKKIHFWIYQVNSLILWLSFGLEHEPEFNTFAQKAK